MPIKTLSDRPKPFSRRAAILLVSGATLVALLLGWTATAQASEIGGRLVPSRPSASQVSLTTGKLAPDLLSLVNALRGMSSEKRLEGSQWRADHLAPPVFKIAGPGASHLEVYLHVADTSRKALRELRELGVIVEHVEPAGGVIQGYAPLEAIETLAELPIIERIARPNYSICNTAQSGFNQGAYITEAERLMEIDFFRGSAGLDGTGQTIGVLSVGLFDMYHPPISNASDGQYDKRVLRGDYPSVNPQTERMEDLGGIRVFPASDYSVHTAPAAESLTHIPWDLARTVDPVTGLVGPVDYDQVRSLVGPLALGRPRAAGALMLEVVRDLVPNARLLFGAARTDVEFFLNREHLVNHGAKVVVDDVSFPGIGRYDGTSALSVRGTELVQNHDIVLVTAVGDFTPPVITPDPGDGLQPTPTPVLHPNLVAAGKPLFINTFFNPNPSNASQKFHSFAPPNTTFRDEALDVRADPVLGYFEAFLVWDDVWINPRYNYTDSEGNYWSNNKSPGAPPTTSTCFWPTAKRSISPSRSPTRTISRMGAPKTRSSASLRSPIPRSP